MPDLKPTLFNRWLKSLILWSYGWRKRSYRASGKLRNQWRDPNSGLWYGDSVAMRIVVAEVLRPYNRC